MPLSETPSQSTSFFTVLSSSKAFTNTQAAGGSTPHRQNLSKGATIGVVVCSVASLVVAGILLYLFRRAALQRNKSRLIVQRKYLCDSPGKGSRRELIVLRSDVPSK